MHLKYFFLPVILSAAVCNSHAASNTSVANSKSSAPAKDVAIKTAEFSSTIKASEDFYEYVNQKWSKANPIPSDKSNYGMFDVLNEQSKITVKKILENATRQKTAAKGSNLQILGDFYRSAMDTVMIEKAGIKPLLPFLNAVQDAATSKDIAKTMAVLQLRNINTPIGYYVDVDAKNSSRYIMYIGQGGLGLPDKDFYFRTDEKSKKTLEGYKKYITNIFQITSLNNGISAERQADNVMEVEMAIANASFSRVELRDPEKNYNLYTIEKLKAEYTNFDWDAFFGEMKATPKEVVVGQPSFFKALDSLLAAIPHDKWVSYQQFHIINSNARYLNNSIVNTRFNFFGKMLSGAKTMEARWKRVSGVSEDLLRDLIGQEYVKTKFSSVAKKRALDLVENIRASLAERLKSLTWMGDATKAKALEKLEKIDVKIGYPDKWWTYENTDVSNQPYVSNVLNCSYAENLRTLARLGKDKIDRTEWGMAPQTVNAYYNPLINEIVFPAAILQPPFFYENGDDAVNYGGIGMVIGHEITHGFDDQGSQYDAEGNLKNWWTEEDKKNYEGYTDKFVKQYNKYSPFPEDSIYVNGELTLGENIADLGGMIISLNALKKAVGKDAKLISGLTPEQRFFINYAIIWRTNMRPESMRMQILSNEHSPAKYRVNGVLSNLPDFHNAFNVKTGDIMYNKEEERAKMW